MTRIILVLSLLLVGTQAYFQDLEHRQEARKFFLDFVNQFTSQYQAISAEGLDYMSQMRLALDYWVTQIRVHNFAALKIDYDVDHDIIEITAPTFNIDLIIEEKYTIPIKIEDLFISVMLNIGQTHFRCQDVEIDYGSVSLDMNAVIEYLSRQLLSLEMVKNAIKSSEQPLRNLITSAIRSNHQRLHAVINELRNDEYSTANLINQLPEVPYTRVNSGEYIINIRGILGFESQKTAKKDDL